MIGYNFKSVFYIWSEYHPNDFVKNVYSLHLMEFRTG